MAVDARLIDALRQLVPFQSFSLDDLTLLSEFAALRKIRTGETIFCQGEPSPYCFGVLSGQVTLHRMIQGNPQPVETLATYSPGQLFGEFSLLGEVARPGMASVTQDGELLSLWASRFRQWVENHRSLSGEPSVLSSLRRVISL